MFRQEVKISSLFTDELFTAKVPIFFLPGEVMCTTSRNLRQIWIDSVILLELHLFLGKFR